MGAVDSLKSLCGWQGLPPVCLWNFVYDVTTDAAYFQTARTALWSAKSNRSRVRASIGPTTVHLYSALRKRLKCAQTWITQFYLQITPCLPSLPSRRTSSPFGWYSFYRPTEGRRLSRPGRMVTYRNKVPPPGPGETGPPTFRLGDQQCIGLSQLLGRIF